MDFIYLSSCFTQHASLGLLELLRLFYALPDPVPPLPSVGSGPSHDATVSLGHWVLRLWLLVISWRRLPYRVFRPTSITTSYVLVPVPAPFLNSCSFLPPSSFPLPSLPVPGIVLPPVLHSNIRVLRQKLLSTEIILRAKWQGTGLILSFSLTLRIQQPLLLSRLSCNHSHLAFVLSSPPPFLFTLCLHHRAYHGCRSLPPHRPTPYNARAHTPDLANGAVGPQAPLPVCRDNDTCGRKVHSDLCYTRYTRLMASSFKRACTSEQV